MASSLIRLKEQGKSLSELKDFLEKNADPDKFLEVLPASVTPEEAPPVIKRDPILFASPEHAKKREEIMGVLLTDWRSTIPGSDLVVVSFGSADDIKTGDAAQQREPEFVKEARNNGKIVSVLNIDSKFPASIVRHGQSTLDTPFRFRWDEQDCKNREIFNAFLNDLLKTTPVVLADYVGGHLKSLKKLIASGIDRESLEKLTLIGGWGCRLPVFLVKPSDMQIPDELPYYNQSGSLISTDQELKECNETRAIPFLILDRIPLSAIDEGLALTTKQSTAGAPSFADVRLFTTPPGKKGTDQGAEEKVEPKTPRQ